MKALRAAFILIAIVVTDVVTKALAVSMLPPNGMPVPVIENGLRLALVYNPGAAFGLYLGAYSRWIFMALTFGALAILWQLYQQTRVEDRRRITALAMVAAGAVGNLLDRIRSELGVVDFIDVGYGVYRWPTFNVADMAVSVGAFMLAWVLWREEQHEAAAHAVPARDAASPDSFDVT